MKAATGQFPYYAVPRTIWCTLDPWTVENGLITPTLKLKRNGLHALLDAEIKAMYS
jgi:long-chain acyl-CoA synthetase